MPSSNNRSLPPLSTDSSCQTQDLNLSGLPAFLSHIKNILRKTTCQLATAHGNKGSKVVCNDRSPALEHSWSIWQDRV